MIPKIEQQDPKKIQQFQEEKLQELLQYLSTHSPYYQRIFKEYHIRRSPKATHYNQK